MYERSGNKSEGRDISIDEFDGTTMKGLGINARTRIDLMC